MCESSDKNFPYEIKELTLEQNKEITDIMRGFELEHICIGPKGYFLTKQYEAATIYNFPIKSDDIFVASFPKAGTTWTQELVWLLQNNLDFEKTKSVSLGVRFPFLEATLFEPPPKNRSEGSKDVPNPHFEAVSKAIATLTIEQIEQLPSPRFIKTHLPMSLLPPNLLDTAKVVYITRDPRDVAVSFYHHNKLMRFMAFDAEFRPYWNLFIQNKVLWAPYFESVLEAWEKRNHPNMLFLFYEELSKDFPASIRRVAKFLGKEPTEEQVAELNEYLKFDNFKKIKSVGVVKLQDAGVFRKGEGFVRRGKVGGWRDYFDEEMTEQAEKWIADNLRGTDFSFPHF